MDWAGRSVSEIMRRKMITNEGNCLISQENIDYVKDKCFFHHLEGSQGEDQEIELPDGNKLNISFEKSLLPSRTFTERG